MDQLNLNQLRTLIALLEERNVTRAGEKLHLTQSAISKQLAHLRDYFSDPLLIREGNSYLLSAKAGEILPKVQSILSDIANLKEEESFDPALCRRRFRFASSDYVAQFIFPKVIQRIRQEAPFIDISYEMMKPEYMDQLGQLPLDFVSIMSPSIPENIHSLDLGRDGTVCMMARQHELTRHANPTLETLLDFPFVRINSGSDKDSFFEAYIKAQKLARRIAFEVPFFSAAFEVISQSDALMVVPEHIAVNASKHFALTHCALPLEAPINQYQICWHAMHDKDPAHRWVRNVIAQETRSSIYSPQ